MIYSTAIRNMPLELQPVMFEFVEALDLHFREMYAVRREDFEELRAVVRDLAAAQRRTEQRVEELAEAQKRTEKTLNVLPTLSRSIPPCNPPASRSCFHLLAPTHRRPDSPGGPPPAPTPRGS